MVEELTPTEEHYLKRELLKFQLDKELSALNDQFALRRFGYPFSAEDPKLGTPKTPRKGGLMSVMASPAETISRKSTENDTLGKTGNLTSRKNQDEGTDFPMLSYVLREIIMPFPMFSKDIAKNEEFWKYKVQVFFEHFMSLGFSNSYDREEATKRRRISKKLGKTVLLLFNSGVGVSQEVKYYNQDAFILKQDEKKKTAGVEEFAIPTRESLQYLYTNEPVFINGWDINIVAVVDDSSLFGRKRLPSEPKPAAFSSKWVKNAFSKPASPAALFSKLGITDSHNTSKDSKYLHYYILKLINVNNPDKTFYTAKSYDDFKQLKRSLKNEFPGKQNARLPRHTKKSAEIVSQPISFDYSQSLATPKEKIISVFQNDSPGASIASSDSNQDSNSNDSVSYESSVVKREKETSDELDDESFEEFHDAQESRSNGLLSEKMRTSLRQYLRTLCGDKEISSSSSLADFFGGDTISQSSFSKGLKEDIERRKAVDITNLENQVQFQKLALEKTLQLRESMKALKTSVLKDEKYLLSFIQELKEKTKVVDLSPLLFSFVEWCKIYVSSTIYQVFLGNDSGYEFFTQIKRLNRLVPYSVMGQIMRFTNPIGIMKAMMDLFMAQPFGSQSLLQTMFSTVLSDDLKSQEKVIQALEQKMQQETSLSSEVIKCLKDCVFKNENDEIISMEAVHKESAETTVPFSLVLLIKNGELGNLSHEAVGEVIESYSTWKAKQSSSSDLPFIEDQMGDRYFSNVKELLQLYIRERDKKLMRRLWQDPELSQLLKSMLTLLYEPMVKIFKVARVDIALKNFERFMNDLIKLVSNVFDGRLGTSLKFNVVESINDLVTKHQDSFLLFIHDVYQNDTEGIFEGFITWFVKIIKFLQNSKYGTGDLRIDFNKLFKEAEINEKLLIDQLDNVIEKKQAARQIYKKMLDSRMKEQKDSKLTAAKVVENNWKELNSLVMPPESNAFGLQDGEIVDLDLDAADYGHLFEEGDDKELETKYQSILNKELDESEIEKFGELVFADALENYLNSLV